MNDVPKMSMDRQRLCEAIACGLMATETMARALLEHDERVDPEGIADVVVPVADAILRRMGKGGT